MRTIESTIYTFDELSPRAKEAARQWYREVSRDDSFYSECITDDAKHCAKILGINIDDLYWSGFWSQGDGACFTGWYSYAKGAAKAIRAHAPQDAALHKIADILQDLQRLNFYGAACRVTHQGRYCHEYSMRFDWENTVKPDMLREEDQMQEVLRDFARWFYARLEESYEWENSDETVDENIRANEYEFTEEGVRA